MSNKQHPWGSAFLLIMAAVLAVTLSLLIVPVKSAPAVPQALAPSCPASRVAGGHDYHGLTLTMCNFTGQDLTNANFTGATLTAVVFIKANLTGADFSGSTIADSGNPAFPTDFSFATLTNAKFIGAKFTGATYLTYATLTCADFSQTDINTGSAIFGDTPLAIDTTQSCRTKFQQTTMNCEFVAQWNRLDLTGAQISACAGELQTAAGQPGHDFSGGLYANVVFDNLDLTNSTWKGTVLEQASFTGATLDGANFEGATLTNADLTYVHASGAIFSQAHLEADQVHGVAAATLNHAYLANAKFDGANLSYADFSFAMLNGPNATVANATLTGSTWVGANLSGLDLSTVATAVGVNLENANLANTTLKNANLSYNLFEAQGTTTVVGAKLDTTYLCGCTLDSTNLTCADLTNAYILSAPQTNPDGNGTPASCAATVITNVKTDNVHTTSPPVTCDTTCPDGTRGPCANNDQWKYRQTGPAQCCVAPKGGPPCPPRKREGAPCTKDCDCHSAKCTSGACAPDSSGATPARRLP